MNTTQQSALATIIATAVVEALGAHFDAEAPAKVTRPARKAPARKAPAKASTTKVTHLVRKNRLEFVAANPWATGMSTYDIAVAVVCHKAPVAKGWAIGERYVAEAGRATAAQKRAVKAQLA